MKLKTLSIAIACMFAGAAVAQTQSPPSYPSGSRSSTAPSASFESLDKNGDGFISKDEAKKDRTLSQQWKQLDTDKDGKLSRSEYDAGSAAGSSTPGSSGGGSSTTPDGSK